MAILASEIPVGTTKGNLSDRIVIVGLGRELEILRRHTEVVVRESGYEANHFEHCLRHNRFVEASVQLLQ